MKVCALSFLVAVFCSFNVSIAKAIPPQIEAKSEFMLADKLFNEKNYSGAIQHAEKAKKLLGKSNSRIEYMLTKAYLNNKQYQRAMIAVDTFFAVTPESKSGTISYIEMVELYSQIKVIATTAAKADAIDSLALLIPSSYRKENHKGVFSQSISYGNNPCELTVSFFRSPSGNSRISDSYHTDSVTIFELKDVSRALLGVTSQEDVTVAVMMNDYRNKAKRKWRFGDDRKKNEWEYSWVNHYDRFYQNSVVGFTFNNKQDAIKAVNKFNDIIKMCKSN